MNELMLEGVFKRLAMPLSAPYYYVNYLDEADEKQIAVFTSKAHCDAFRNMHVTRWNAPENGEKYQGDLDISVDSYGRAMTLEEIPL